MGGSVLSGMAPWLMLGAILGEMMIGLALQLCQVIRPGLGMEEKRKKHPGFF